MKRSDLEWLPFAYPGSVIEQDRVNVGKPLD